MRPTRPKTALSLCILISWAASATGAEHHDQYRAVLVELMAVAKEIQTHIGREPGASSQIALASDLFRRLSNEQIDDIDHNLPLTRLRPLVERARERLDTADRAQAKTITVETPDPDPSFCAEFPATVAIAALATKLVARAVIKGLEFTCQETVLGFSAGLGCEAPEIAFASAEILAEEADYCFNQVRAGKSEAVLLTERNIGRHLNDFVDAQTSTRATQVSVDDAAARVMTTLSRTQTAQSTIDTDFVQIQAQIGDALDSLGATSTRLTEIIAETDDVAFRTQINLANVEDLQDRAANSQQKAAEITASIDASLSLSNAVSASTGGLSSSIALSAQQDRRDAIAMALSNPNGLVAGHALPVAAGGQLEEVREVVIRAIMAMEDSGLGDTDAALDLLAQGDVDFNTARYVSAYQNFAAAYQALSGSGN